MPDISSSYVVVQHNIDLSNSDKRHSSMSAEEDNFSFGDALVGLFDSPDEQLQASTFDLSKCKIVQESPQSLVNTVEQLIESSLVVVPLELSNTAKLDSNKDDADDLLFDDAREDPLNSADAKLQVSKSVLNEYEIVQRSSQSFSDGEEQFIEIAEELDILIESAEEKFYRLQNAKKAFTSPSALTRPQNTYESTYVFKTNPHQAINDAIAAYNQHLKNAPRDSEERFFALADQQAWLSKLQQLHAAVGAEMAKLPPAGEGEFWAKMVLEFTSAKETITQQTTVLAQLAVLREEQFGELIKLQDQLHSVWKTKDYPSDDVVKCCKKLRDLMVEKGGLESALVALLKEVECPDIDDMVKIMRFLDPVPERAASILPPAIKQLCRNGSELTKQLSARAMLQADYAQDQRQLELLDRASNILEQAYREEVNDGLNDDAIKACKQMQQQIASKQTKLQRVKHDAVVKLNQAIHQNYVTALKEGDNIIRDLVKRSKDIRYQLSYSQKDEYRSKLQQTLKELDVRLTVQQSAHNAGLLELQAEKKLAGIDGYPDQQWTLSGWRAYLTSGYLGGDYRLSLEELVLNNHYAQNGLSGFMEAIQTMSSDWQAGKAEMPDLIDVFRRMGSNPDLMITMTTRLLQAQRILQKSSANSSLSARLDKILKDGLEVGTMRNLMTDALNGGQEAVPGAYPGKPLSPLLLVLMHIATWAPTAATFGNVMAKIPLAGGLLDYFNAMKGIGADVVELKATDHLIAKLGEHRDMELLINTLFVSKGEFGKHLTDISTYVMTRQAVRELGATVRDIREVGVFGALKRKVQEVGSWWRNASFGGKLFMAATTAVASVVCAAAAGFGLFALGVSGIGIIAVVAAAGLLVGAALGYVANGAMARMFNFFGLGAARTAAAVSIADERFQEALDDAHRKLAANLAHQRSLNVKGELSEQAIQSIQQRAQDMLMRVVLKVKESWPAGSQPTDMRLAFEQSLNTLERDEQALIVHEIAKRNQWDESRAQQELDKVKSQFLESQKLAA